MQHHRQFLALCQRLRQPLSPPSTPVCVVDFGHRDRVTCACPATTPRGMTGSARHACRVPVYRWIPRAVPCPDGRAPCATDVAVRRTPIASRAVMPMPNAPLDDTGAQLLFRFVAAAYECRALGVGSHWPFDQWGRFLPEHTTAVSLLDRLLHHSNVVVTEGESFRMREARSRGGGRPKKTEQSRGVGTFTWPPPGTATWPLTAARPAARSARARSANGLRIHDAQRTLAIPRNLRRFLRPTRTLATEQLTAGDARRAPVAPARRPVRRARSCPRSTSQARWPDANSANSANSAG
jgi:hypothetical protein